MRVLPYTTSSDPRGRALPPCTAPGGAPFDKLRANGYQSPPLDARLPRQNDAEGRNRKQTNLYTKRYKRDIKRYGHDIDSRV